MKPWMKYAIIGAIALGIGLYLYQTGRSAGILKAKVQQLQTEKDQVVKDKDAWIAQTEKEILVDQEKINQIEREKSGLQVKAAQSDAKIAQRDGRIYDLEEKLKKLIVSNDPDIIITDINKYLGSRGLSPIRRRGP